jgi:hydroxyacyl-ACP dehydratase HTD2-like protein with hotdog domain
MSEFGGKSMTRRQLLDGNQLQKLALPLGRPRIGAVDISEDAPPTGTPVHPGYHLVYFTPNGLEDELGADGTDRTFNAPSPFTRRMWAGGTMKWPGIGNESSRENSPLLRVGDVAEERTRLVSATAKRSRSAGEMVLVEVEKEFWTPRGLALVDQRLWIFRPELGPGAEAEAPKPPKPLDVNICGSTEIKEVAGENGE